MNERVTPEEIKTLKHDEVFVFGSNESGYHGAGAALLAWKKFGAKYGLGFGPYGKTFALPTKSWYINYTLKTSEIEPYVTRFIDYARHNKNRTFYVTQIGCGIAGYKPEDIAPLFEEAVALKNIYLPQSFWDVLNS